MKQKYEPVIGLEIYNELLTNSKIALSGVLFHCKRGYDRTGIIALLLLALAGVSPEDIVADYELSVDLVREELLASKNTTTREVILSTLASLDIDNYLLAGGLNQNDLNAIRVRFIEPIN